MNDKPTIDFNKSADQVRDPAHKLEDDSRASHVLNEVFSCANTEDGKDAITLDSAQCSDIIAMIQSKEYAALVAAKYFTVKD